MSIFQAFVLGAIQGLTEFLPISSSGHLVFVPQLLGWEDQGLTFDVVVHLGTLLAVVIYFRKTLWLILRSLLTLDRGINIDFSRTRSVSRSPHEYRRLGLLLLITIIPAGIVGFFFNDAIELYFRSASIVGWSLIFWGIVLAVADFYSRSALRTHPIQNVRFIDAIFIGTAQALALIPGTSRSGITMTAGLFARLDKKSAAEFSFLMSVPIIALAGGLKILEQWQAGLAGLFSPAFLIGFFASFLSGLLAIWVLLKIIERWSYVPFAVYRVLVGVAILLFIV